MVGYSVRAVSLEKIYKSEGVEVRALEEASFTQKEGDFAAIVGPSGSGKSTLMNILGTIDKPTQGEVYINGVATSKMNGDELAAFRNKTLGFVFQAFNLINGLDIEKNVEMPLIVTSMPKEERRRKATELLEKLGLGARLKLKPNQISGGEQQRVAVARALINDPTLILADEPTGNLDTKTGEGVIRLLRDVSKNSKVTTVMVTHNPDLTQYCDKIIHIRDGRIEKILVKK